jgi:DNA-binding response OmpR family regulator
MPASIQSDVPDNPTVVLAVTPFPDDQRLLRTLFSRSNWELKIVRTQQEAAEVLRTEPVPVVICENILPDGGWRGVADAADAFGSRPRVLVTSRCADESLWCEVLEQGAYDCLSKPFRSEEVFRLVSLAWRSWRSETGRLSRTEQAYAAPALA